MLKRFVHIVFSVFLGVLLVFGGVSKEYLHLFAGHTDTVHTHDYEDGLTFENEHHHCDFLAFTLAPFISCSNSLNILVLPAEYQQFDSVLDSALLPTYISSFQSRGPPAYSA